ncbi:DNA/RNA nuclease SfsA [Desulfonema magnum]|uniref:Sugar fermentation stimulation protein homolog n=1 Tax=Desulfonema magnum TaxID=45655 RepID=A0A975BT25_9BACT|nr:DNA/RNA nuclease SfsA [Desulfonema magnum]QTA90580.1 Sugar fermentation stimulation protein A [Desulfonema magnum]
MKSEGLTWPALIPGTLIRRYKRFLADVKLESGEVVTAHCPNSGTMKECCDPGNPVYLSYHDNPKRKLKYTWELIRMSTSLVGVNTLVPNRLVFKSVDQGRVKELRGYDTVNREPRVGSHSRLDLLLKKGENDACYVEIKNCTLVKDGIACFPDAVTSRGLKHLVELQNLVSSGYRCVMFYLIQRTDAKIFRPADHIDPAYGKELRRAVNHGVEIMAYDVRINLERICLNNKIPYDLQAAKSQQR